MAHAMESERPNIVVFLCDQLRKDFLSLYGCRAIPTPNLDRLASMGVTFDRAITASPVCGPARACMMTGRHVSDHGVWTNDVPFRDGLEYLAERMNAAGYRTGAFGKMHHTPGDDPKGFAVTRLMEERRLGDRDDYFVWLKARRPEVTSLFNHDRERFLLPLELYYEHWIASEAIRFIEDGPAGRPFFAWVSFQGPHGPHDPPEAFKGSVDVSLLPRPLQKPLGSLADTSRYRREREGALEAEEAMRQRELYAECVACIDAQIGRVLGSLDRSGLTERTVFIFSADHGDLLGDFGLLQKGPYPYRSQLEVPLVVANHPRGAAGSRTDALASNLDIGATALELAGDSGPFGLSRPLLGGPPRPMNFSEFCDSMKLAEDGRYRYAYYPFSGQADLFDLEEDPDELRNLAGDPSVADVERRLLMGLVDLAVLNRGPRVEAHDLHPSQQGGLVGLDPRWVERLPVAFPLHAVEVERLRAAGLDAGFNEAFRNRPVLASYAPPYWENET